MTDEQLQELLQDLMRFHRTPEAAALDLYVTTRSDSKKLEALCRYVINRLVPLKGTVG